MRSKKKFKYKKKKVYKVPQECLDHYQQYLKAKDVDGKN